MKNKKLKLSLLASLVCVACSVNAENFVGETTVEDESSKLDTATFDVSDKSSVVIVGSEHYDTADKEDRVYAIYTDTPDTKYSISADSVTIESTGRGIELRKKGELNINGKYITISGGERAISIYDQSSVKIGTSETEELKFEGPVMALFGDKQKGKEYSGSQVNLQAKTININSNQDFALHAQSNDEKWVLPEEERTAFNSNR